MANIPSIRSKEQIFGDLVEGFKARRPEISDLSRGSVANQLFTAIAQSQFKASASVIGMIDASSVDRAIGEALQRLARDSNVPIFPATSATGKIAITDASFVKVSSSVYAGQPAPVAGSLKIYVTDASKFQATNGKIYIGRKTTNLEGPLEYSSIQAEAGGAYWSINLKSSSPTTKFHNIGEEVLMAQGGNRLITAGAIAQTAQGAAITSLQFRTTADVMILDGETVIDNVPVICTRPGVVGNIPRGALREAIGFPFSATVFNSNPFFTGREADDDDQIRARIKLYEQSKARGTIAAIQYFSQNVVASDEQKKVQSSTVVTYADNSASLVFDDGTGYEPLFVGAGFEFVMDNATGGEQELQLRNRPIAQARIKNNKQGPYAITDLSGLSVQVGSTITSHQFSSDDFKVPSAATCFEVASSINGNPNLNFLASTAEGGTKVVLYPRNRYANDIQVKAFTLTDSDANDVLGFPLVPENTLRLYVNDNALHEDGLSAAVLTRSKADWISSIVSGDTLSYEVDGAAAFTATFTTALFQSIKQTAVVNYLEDINTWVEAFKLAMPGVSARVVENKIELSSNLGENNRAAIKLTGGTLLSKMFDPLASLSSTGRAPDYTFNKYTGQISLTTPLSSGDKLTAGSAFTRAKVVTTSIPQGTTSAGKFWVIVDGASEFVPNSLNSNSQIRFSKSGTKLTIDAKSSASLPEGFDNVESGDWLLVWSNSDDSSQLIGNSGFWRVESVTTGQIVVDDGTTSRSGLNSWFIPTTDRLVFVRSKAPIQQVSFTQTSLSNFVNELQTQLVGCNIEIVGGAVRISTQTADETGELFFVQADNGGKNLLIPVQKAVPTITSQYGFSQNSITAEVDIPSFVMGEVEGVVSESEIILSDYYNLGGTDYDFVEFRDNYDVSAEPVNVPESNRGRRAFVKNFDEPASTLTLTPKQYLRNLPTTPPTGSTVQAGDRFFLRSSYQFDYRDQATVIVDEDAVTKTYRLPVARKIQVNAHSTPTTVDFSADDAESSLSLADAASFGSSFLFDDFRCWRQAYAFLTDGNYNLKFMYADHGPAGNKIRVGFNYPSSVSATSLTHSVDVSDMIDVHLTLPVKTPRTPNWAANSCFTTAVTNTGGAQEIVYTWRTGTQPDFAAAEVVPGDIVMINSNSSFLSGSKGISAKVTSVSATSFTVKLPDNNIQGDMLEASNIVNQNGTITINFPTDHNIKANDTIGLWDTAISVGSTKPLDGAYTSKVNSSTEITITAPTGLPGGSVTGVNHINGLVTLNIPNHGFVPGNIILVSGVAIPALNGKYAVYDVPSSNTVRYVKPGSYGSAAAGGRADFQSYSVGSTSASISTIARVGSTVTVDTSSDHGLLPGMLVKVSDTDISTYSAITTYSVGDVIKYLGDSYVSLVNLNTGNQPDISPGNWSLTTQSFDGIWVVNSVPSTTQFTWIHHASGAMTGLSSIGYVAQMVTAAKLARGVGGQTSPYLQFTEVGTTAQEVVDYAANNMADIVSVKIASGDSTAKINTSTSDLDAAANYFYGPNAIVGKKTSYSTRQVDLISSVYVPPGSTIRVSGMSDVILDGEYVVLSTDTYGANWALSVWSEVLSSAVSATSESASFVGYRSATRLQDGENSVAVTALNSLIGSPQFTLKYPWSTAPDEGEALYLVAVNNDQLHRFWNKLVVTGLSNVATIDNCHYGDQLQITTKTFGSNGSIDFAGGSANSQTLAAVGSSSTIGTTNESPEGKLGAIFVPYDLRKPITAGQWLTIDNELRGNKRIGFDSTTGVQLHNDGIEIFTGAGSFQTKYATTQDQTTVLKFEQQGKFFAIYSIAGAALNLSAAGVKEGSWVRLKNADADNWNVSASYSAGQRITYNQVIYTALSSNTGVIPSSNSAIWQVTQLSDANQGIFRVVRVFGENTFWVESSTMSEEICYLGATDSIGFYSYDSIMPGDTLVISTTLLGAQNIGRYIVSDSIFPTSTRIYTTTIPNPPSLPYLLGGEANQINVEEKDPIRLWKHVNAIGPGPSGLAAILVDTPELVARTGESSGTSIKLRSKLEFNENVNFGVDAYKYYKGLIKELTRVVYGDPTSPVSYPGVRAAGTSIEIQPAVVKRIKIDLSARIRSGVPFGEVRDKIKSSVAGYVNTLGVGKAVSLSRVVAVANAVPGVVAVAVSYPAYDIGNDIISVGAQETPLVIDPTTDITVSVIGL